MPINENVLSAIGGGGLTADDYAGLTPEQIQAVAGQGQKDRQIMLGTVMDMSQQELAERKQQNEEFFQHENLKLMKRKDARDEFQTIHSARMDRLKVDIEKKRLQLDGLRTTAAVQADNKQMALFNKQIESLDRQQKTIDAMKEKKITLPGLDDQGKPVVLSLAEMHELGVLDNAIAAGADAIKSSSMGTSKVIQQREYVARQAEILDADPVVVTWIRMMGPEGLKNMTPQALHNSLLKTNPLYAMKATSTDPKAKEEMQKILNAQFDLINIIKMQASVFMYDQLDATSTGGYDEHEDKSKPDVDGQPDDQKPRQLTNIYDDAERAIRERRAKNNQKF